MLLLKELAVLLTRDPGNCLYNKRTRRCDSPRRHADGVDRPRFDRLGQTTGARMPKGGRVK